MNYYRHCTKRNTLSTNGRRQTEPSEPAPADLLIVHLGDLVARLDACVARLGSLAAAGATLERPEGGAQ